MAVAWLWCGIYLAILLLAGTALYLSISGKNKRSWAECAGLVLTLGVGAGALCLLGLSFLGLRPGRTALAIVALGSALIILFCSNRRRIAFPARPILRMRGLDWFSVPALLSLLVALTATTIIAVGFPIFEWDSVVIWGMKARVLFESPLTPRPWYFSEVRYNASHLDYPLLMPMMLAGAYGAMRQAYEPAARAVLPMLFAGFILLHYSAVRFNVSRPKALLLTIMVLCAPYLLSQATLGTADVPLATFHAGALIYMSRWIAERQRSDMIFAAVFTLLAGLTKAEGLPLALLSAILLTAFAAHGIRRRTIALDLLIFVGVISVGLGLWIAWRAFIPHTDEDYVGRARWSILIENISRLPTILRAFAHHLFDPTKFGIVSPTLVVFAAIGYRGFRSANILFLWVFLLSHLLLYVLIYVITPWDLTALIRDSMDRLIIHIIPTAGLLIAAHWNAIPQRT